MDYGQFEFKTNNKENLKQPINKKNKLKLKQQSLAILSILIINLLSVISLSLIIIIFRITRTVIMLFKGPV